MSVTPPLADLFKYNQWANLRLLDACASLDSAVLDAIVPGTYGSIRQTLLHVAAGEEGYVARFTGKRPERPQGAGDSSPDFDELRRRIERSGEALIAIAERFEPGQMLQIPYEGVIHEVGGILVLAQALTHAADHRSQVATILTQHGVNPPESDGWAYAGSLEQA